MGGPPTAALGLRNRTETEARQRVCTTTCHVCTATASDLSPRFATCERSWRLCVHDRSLRTREHRRRRCRRTVASRLPSYLSPLGTSPNRQGMIVPRGIRYHATRDTLPCHAAHSVLCESRNVLDHARARVREIVGKQKAQGVGASIRLWHRCAWRCCFCWRAMPHDSGSAASCIGSRRSAMRSSISSATFRHLPYR